MFAAVRVIKIAKIKGKRSLLGVRRLLPEF
jgi:hypothetical protein